MKLLANETLKTKFVLRPTHLFHFYSFDSFQMELSKTSFYHEATI